MSQVAVLPPPTAPQQDVNLRQYWEIIQRRKAQAIVVFIVIFLIGAFLALQQAPQYQATAQVLVPTPSFALNVYDSNNPISALLVDAQPDTLETQLQLMNTPDFLAAAAERAGVRAKPGVAYPSPTISAVENASIINVAVTGGDPQDVSLYAKAIVELHLERAKERNREGLERATQHAQERVNQLNEVIRQLNGRINDHYAKNPLMHSGAAQDQLGADYSQIMQRQQAARTSIAATRQELIRAQARLRSLPRLLTEEQERVNPRHTRLQQMLDELMVEREQKLTMYREDRREITDLDKQIRNVEKLLKNVPAFEKDRNNAINPEWVTQKERVTQLEGELFAAERDLRAAETQAASLRPVVMQSGPNSSELGALKAELDEKHTQLGQYQKTLNDLLLRRDAMPESFRIIQAATEPTAPFAPDKKKLILVALSVAVLLAIALTLFAEFIDDRIHSPADVERNTTLPTLAHIPLLNRDQPRLVSSLPANSQVSEAYRALRSSVGFAAIDAPIRRILVTSPSKGEGKSVTSANLATSMALDGRRVILVDADLRKPNVHHLFGLSVSPGLSEVLAGLADIQDVLHETGVENLRAITAGAIPPNPAELLGSRSFEQIIEQLEGMADVVIFDSPPCVPVTDPLILASRMDGVILVTHIGQTHKKAVRQAEHLLARARARVLGIVFNRVPVRKGQYYYYYGYGYGYGGYGADTTVRPGPSRDLLADDDFDDLDDAGTADSPKGPRTATLRQENGRGRSETQPLLPGRSAGEGRSRRGEDLDLDI